MFREGVLRLILFFLCRWGESKIFHFWHSFFFKRPWNVTFQNLKCISFSGQIILDLNNLHNPGNNGMPKAWRRLRARHKIVCLPQDLFKMKSSLKTMKPRVEVKGGGGEAQPFPLPSMWPFKVTFLYHNPHAWEKRYILQRDKHFSLQLNVSPHYTHNRLSLQLAAFHGCVCNFKKEQMYRIWWHV